MKKKVDQNLEGARPCCAPPGSATVAYMLRPLNSRKTITQDSPVKGKSHVMYNKAIFAKWNGAWLSRGCYGVYALISM